MEEARYLLDDNGDWIVNEEYKEIVKLHEMLKSENIPHKLMRCYDGWQIIYPNILCSAAIVFEHFNSAGHEEDLLELSGLLTDTEAFVAPTRGYMSADQAFERIKEYNEEMNKEG